MGQFRDAAQLFPANLLAQWFVNNNNNNNNNNNYNNNTRLMALCLELPGVSKSEYTC